TITVTNVAASAGTYDLEDALQFGEGVSVVSASVANTAPGDIVVNATWNGVDDTMVVDDAPIAAATGAATPTVHTYTVTVIADVAVDISADAADCEVGAGESGTGFLNAATLSVNGEPSDAEACAEVPRTEFDKALSDVVSNGDGTYALTYELTVTRTGGPGTYDLRDELRYGTAVTVGPVTVSTFPAGLPVNAGFDGVGDTLVASGVAIGDGETHL